MGEVFEVVSCGDNRKSCTKNAKRRRDETNDTCADNYSVCSRRGREDCEDEDGDQECYDEVEKDCDEDYESCLKDSEADYKRNGKDCKSTEKSCEKKGEFKKCE